jgi:hypothetical protein
MSITNGHRHPFPDATSAADWQSILDYAADQERHPWPSRDKRHACGNPDCATLTEALYCSEACRLVVEGDNDAPAQDGEGCLLDASDARPLFAGHVRP